MGILASTRRRQGISGRWIMVPRDVTAPKRRRSRLIRKRRQTFIRLLLLAGATLVAGLVPGLHWVLFLHLAADATLAFYVAQLLQWKRTEVEEDLAQRERVRAVRGPEPRAAEHERPRDRAVGH